MEGEGGKEGGREEEGRRGVIDDELMHALRISCTARRRMQEITNFTLLTTTVTSAVAADRSKDTRLCSHWGMAWKVKLPLFLC